MLRFVGFLALSLLALLAPGVAEAQGPPKAIVVVDVLQGDPALDANRLHAAVASELDADAVTSDDPRASRASGTLRVSIDRAAHALVVAYAYWLRPGYSVGDGAPCSLRYSHLLRSLRCRPRGPRRRAD